MPGVATVEGVLHEVYACKFAEHTGTRGHYFYGSAGDPHDAPVDLDFFVWLIRPVGSTTDADSVVVDAGFCAEVAARRNRRHLRRPSDALAALGVDVANVRTVVLSHLHYDHIGDLEPFELARFVLQEREMAFWTGRFAGRREYRALVEPDDVAGLVHANFAGRVHWVDGDAEIAPGVSVHLVGGHSPGLQAVRVATAAGPVVLALDAAHFWSNLEADLPFGIVHDLAGMYAAFDRLRELSGPDGMVVPGHDPALMRRYLAVEGLNGVAVRIA
ncbi:MAG: N-acyl homoserine lactonase family protein [Actinobacteria bacterium]|nr:N-acyl homoserine lactonase family protein [Actinomycetota bacterium]